MRILILSLAIAAASSARFDLLQISSISPFDFMRVANDARDCPQAVHDALYAFADAALEVMQRPKSPSEKVFIDIRIHFQEVALICYHKQRDYSRYDPCIKKTVPIWTNVYTIVEALENSDNTAAAKEFVVMLFNLQSAVDFCSKI